MADDGSVMPDAVIPPELQILRDSIDGVDQRILELLAQRSGIVGRIADVKKTHRMGIRDEEREEQLLADRQATCADLALPFEFIESLFRLILWSSRDRQAALGTELPPDLPERTVAIIGGRGGMGSCFARMFREMGQKVLIADLDTDLDPVAAAQQSDVVLISVPIRSTQEVIQAIGPHCREDGLLMDLTSIKTSPVNAMLASSPASVIGLHPLFGPDLHTLQGQRIVLVPARLHDNLGWLPWIESLLGARGLLMVHATAEEHDEAMSIIQVLVHFSTEVMGLTLSRLGVPVEQTLRFTSPVYLLELLMTARHFAQSPDLYGAIHMSNDNRTAIMSTFSDAVHTLHETIESGSQDEFDSLFHEVRDYFGDFSAYAQDQSSFLIDRLVERT